jgi:phospholipid/cholesterol/gamma-HCH transport system substrate-binding protein
MSGTERREYLVGIVVASALAALLVLTALGNRPDLDAGNGAFHLTAGFSRIDGIGTGSAVRLAGVTVGTVDQVTLEPSFRANVRMRIDRPVQLPTDTAAVIETEGIFGAKYIELRPGGAEEMLSSGGRIDYTQDAVVIEDLIALIVQRAKAGQTP